MTRPKETLHDLKVLVQMAAKNLKLEFPFHGLTMGMIRVDAKPPRMKTKAAETRRLLPCVVWLFQNMLVAEDDTELIVVQMLTRLNNCYEAMYAWRDGGGFDSKTKFVHHGKRFLLKYAELSGEVFWRLYPKFHLLHHILDRVPYCGNPSEFWCYRDESEIGLASDMAATVHPLYVHRSLLEKYVL